MTASSATTTITAIAQLGKPPLLLFLLPLPLSVAAPVAVVGSAVAAGVAAGLVAAGVAAATVGLVVGLGVGVVAGLTVGLAVGLACTIHNHLMCGDSFEITIGAKGTGTLGRGMEGGWGGG